MADVLRLETVGSVGVVVRNRPGARNALNGQTVDCITAVARLYTLVAGAVNIPSEMSDTRLSG
jgi:hypothetical protein